MDFRFRCPGTVGVTGGFRRVTEWSSVDGKNSRGLVLGAAQPCALTNIKLIVGGKKTVQTEPFTADVMWKRNIPWKASSGAPVRHAGFHSAGRAVTLFLATFQGIPSVFP